MPFEAAQEIALLGFLRPGPLHGYAIHQTLSNPAALGKVWQIKLSHLYALLAKLEEAGHVTTTTETQDARPPRKLFHLTDAGEQAFQNWLETPVSSGRALRLEFLVKLYFARQAGAGVAAALVAAQREECRRWLATERERVLEETESGRHYSRLVHQFRQGQIEAMLVWLEECEEVWTYEH